MSAEEDEEERRAIVAAATTPLNDLGEYEGFGDGVDSEDLDYYDDQDWEFAVDRTERTGWIWKGGGCEICCMQLVSAPPPSPLLDASMHGRLPALGGRREN
eukprot:3733320-Pyramimonas_sp.AAC.1